MITLNTTSKRLRAAATKLVTTATVMLIGVAATHSAFAIEQVKDADLAAQVGASKYVVGPCRNTGGYVCAVPVNDFSSSCAFVFTQDADGTRTKTTERYQDAV